MTANSNGPEDREPTDADDGSPDERDDRADERGGPPDERTGPANRIEERPDAASTHEPSGVVGRDHTLAEYVQWALLVILLLLVVIASLRFYFAASTAVDRFVARQYRPLFQAAFNLVILLAAGVGLSILVRRLS